MVRVFTIRGGVWNSKWGGTTFTDKAIYVHVLRVPEDGKISLSSVFRKIVSAKYLGTNQKVSYKQTDSGVELNGISSTGNETDVIVKITLK